MKALVFHEPGRIAVEDRPDPAIGPADVLLKTAAAAICYSDIRVYNGLKHARPGVIPGHEIAGTVIETGERVTHVRASQRVAVCPIVACGSCAFCLSGRRHRCDARQTLGYDLDGGIAQYVLLPAALVDLGHVLPAPDALPLERAALTEPIACVLNSLETCRTGIGRSIVIVGAGPMGLCHVLLARRMGASPIIVSEPDEARAAVARRFGADAVIDPRAADLTTAVRERTDGLGADAVVVTTGITEVIEAALACVRRQGVVSLFAGFPPDAATALDPNAVHYSEMHFTGSQNASPEQYRRVLSLLPELPEVDEVTTFRTPLATANEAYEVRLRNEGLKSLVLVEPS